MANFDEIVPRRHTNSVKWDSRPDVPEDIIPLWVADMDFKVCEPIMEALRRRVDQGVFGYTFVSDSYYEAIDRWFGGHYGWHVSADQVIYTSGVVPALSAIIKAFTEPGDKVLIQTPVYNCFFSSIRNNGCRTLESPLRIDRSGDLPVYEIDLEDLERKASDQRCKILLLCNPHNPAGRVWSKETLLKVAEICERHDVIVVSDEIHCDLCLYKEFTPFATVAGGCKWVVCNSPSKAFNIAGLQIANIITPFPEMRASIDRAINDNEVCDVNPFGVQALMAAYTPAGYDWLCELKEYLRGNYEYLVDFFATNLPDFPVFKLEGTYLAWVDCGRIDMSSVDLEEYLISKAHVWINAGSMYGSDGEHFIRINMACPRSVLAEALNRLAPVLKNV